ncbi:hypothetical protein P9222_13715 [Paenibacillus amylolyticus]|nr:hypothetical protein [Paenibacillus amylolyticus]WFR65731.1 hypothetical protein P9222_13715 [Paenibacillus amylolyticus]
MIYNLQGEPNMEPVVGMHQNEKQATIRWGLWHMADHNRYHQAHINQLRKWFQTKTDC